MNGWGAAADRLLARRSRRSETPAAPLRWAAVPGRRPARAALAGLAAIAAAAVTGCASSHTAGGPSTAHPSTTHPSTTTGGPLVAPQTSTAEDAQYLTDLARVDPGLSSYVSADQQVALKALLTDGAALCAFLHRGGGIDSAMSSVAVGARGVEAQTHLPLSVTTFNAIDAVALVDLCPSDVAMLPAADQGRITQLAAQLHGG